MNTWDTFEKDRIIGSLIWYYYVCKRQIWLTAHSLSPFQDNPYLELGRFIQEQSYKGHKKSLRLENLELDLIHKEGEKHILLGEIKKSSWNSKSACMQLAFYLKFLKSYGVQAKGEVLIPREKKRISVTLTSEIERELEQVEKEIVKIANQKLPPPAEKIDFCCGCGWREFCWTD